LLTAGVYPIALIGTGEDGAATGDLDLTANVTLIGAGASQTIIDGQAVDRVIHIPLTTTRVTLSGLTIRNGNPGVGIFGGGISNAGALTLTASLVRDNTGPGGGGGITTSGRLTLRQSSIQGNTAEASAGGIFNIGTLTVINSSVFSNTGGGTGGIFNDPVGVLTLTNSTVSGNIGSGVANGGIMNLSNVTLTNNRANSGGGGIAHFAGVTSLKNTIVAENKGPDSSPDCSGTLTSQGYNLIQSVAGCAITTTNNLIGVSPRLGPLQDHGGLSLSQALLSGSPAINAGNPTLPGSGGNACEGTDQRGVTRPQNGRCDIGAYEAIPPLFLPLILKSP
jgi:hypothetical protein